MRRILPTRSILIASIIVSLSAASVGGAADEKESRYDKAFIGFPVGSWALQRQGAKRGSAGLTKYTIFPEKDGRPKVRWQRVVDGKARSTSTRTYYAKRTPEQDRAVAHDRGKETLKIDGRALDCNKIEYVHGTRGPGPGRKTTMAVWTSDAVKVPERKLLEHPQWRIASNVVKLIQKTEGHGFSLTVELAVTDIDAKIEVGGKTITAIKERYTFHYDSETHDKRIEGEWAHSFDVPAHLVYQRMKGTEGGKPYEKHIELVDFVIGDGTVPDDE